MNLLQTVLRGHSKAMCNQVVAYVGDNPGRFRDLVELFLKGPYRVTQRAAWPLSYSVKEHPQLIKPHLKRIVQFLKSGERSDSAKRNILRLLQFIEIPVSLQGAVSSACYGFLTSGKEPVAIRVFAMTVLGIIAKVQSDMQKELCIIIEDQLPYATPGFASRARKVMRMLKERTLHH